MLAPTVLLGLYPRRWRARYGDEFAALLEEMTITPATVLDLLSGAFDAHLRQRVSDKAAARTERALVIGGKLTMGTALGIVLAVIIWAVAIIIEGGDLATYVLPSPILLVVGGTLCALLVAYGGSGITSLPGLIGRAFRGPIRLDPGAASENLARYQLGHRLFGDAGRFALLTGMIASLLGVVITLSSFMDRPAAQLGHGLAVSLTGVVYGLVLAIFCYALSANLRHKGEQASGTLGALTAFAERERERTETPAQTRFGPATSAS